MPLGLIVGALAILLVGGIGPNFELAVLSVVVLLAAGALLWRPGEAPVLLFVFVFPWLQASTSIFHANWAGLDVATHGGFAGDITMAIILSLVGVLTLALGMRLGAGPISLRTGFLAQSTASSQPVSRWLMLYAAASVVAYVALAASWIIPGLSQLMLAIAATKWLFFFMLAYASFVRGGGVHPLFLAAFFWEIALGLGSFFSDFKVAFLVTMIAVLAAGVRVSLSAVLGAAVLGVVLIGFSVVWTAVKGDFRAFVSAGEANQTVSVDYLPRMAKLYELVEAIDGEVLQKAGDQMLRRLTYVEFFGVVLTTVPSTIPHESGALLWDAISRPFMPRFFFPDKAVIDDSVRTNIYTHGAAGDSEGTSISLGWIAETYIDFGEFGMFAAVLLIGYFYGSIYRVLTQRTRMEGLFGMAAACGLLLQVGLLENSFTKVFGGVIVQLLIIWLLTKYGVPRFCPWVAATRG